MTIASPIVPHPMNATLSFLNAISSSRPAMVPRPERREPAPGENQRVAEARYDGDVASASPGGPRDPVVRKALEILVERLSEPVGPAELARSVHVPLRTLQRAVDRELGCTPRELIVGSKMKAAREMLESGLYRVNEAATRVGFTDPAHFSRRYKACFGVSPSRTIPSRNTPGTTQPEPPHSG